VRQFYGQAHQVATQELQQFISRTEELLHTLNDEGVESTDVLRERIAVGIESLQKQVDEAMESADDAARMGRELIRQNPWASIGLGAGVGLAIGWAVSAGGRALHRSIG
jgi:ElaB/YqjD/DUF883 family membrane-anchored ribosome-binding protein